MKFLTLTKIGICDGLIHTGNLSLLFSHIFGDEVGGWTFHAAGGLNGLITTDDDPYDTEANVGTLGGGGGIGWGVGRGGPLGAGDLLTALSYIRLNYIQRTKVLFAIISSNNASSSFASSSSSSSSSSSTFQEIQRCNRQTRKSHMYLIRSLSSLYLTRLMQERETTFSLLHPSSPTGSIHVGEVPAALKARERDMNELLRFIIECMNDDMDESLTLIQEWYRREPTQKIHNQDALLDGEIALWEESFIHMFLPLIAGLFTMPTITPTHAASFITHGLNILSLLQKLQLHDDFMRRVCLSESGNANNDNNTNAPVVPSPFKRIFMPDDWLMPYFKAITHAISQGVSSLTLLPLPLRLPSLSTGLSCCMELIDEESINNDGQWAVGCNVLVQEWADVIRNLYSDVKSQVMNNNKDNVIITENSNMTTSLLHESPQRRYRTNSNSNTNSNNEGETMSKEDSNISSLQDSLSFVNDIASKLPTPAVLNVDLTCFAAVCGMQELKLPSFWQKCGLLRVEGEAEMSNLSTSSPAISTLLSLLGGHIPLMGPGGDSRYGYRRIHMIEICHAQHKICMRFLSLC